MRNLVLLGLCGLIYSAPAMARPATHLPAPIVIRGAQPTTENLRDEMLGETTQSFLQKQDVDLHMQRGIDTVQFNTVYDPITKMATYYDGHLLQDLNRTDNPYGHNRPGFSINF